VDRASHGLPQPLVFARRDLVSDKGYDILGVGPRAKDTPDPHTTQHGGIFIGNDAADEHQNVIHALLVQQLHNTGAQGHVGAR